MTTVVLTLLAIALVTLLLLALVALVKGVAMVAGRCPECLAASHPEGWSCRD